MQKQIKVEGENKKSKVTAQSMNLSELLGRNDV